MVIATQQRVQIIAEMIVKNAKSFQRAMTASMGRMKEIQTRQGTWNKRTKEGSTRMGRLGLNVRKAAHGMRGFRMEMLSVMFAGMFLQRVLTGLLRTSLEWTGVTEVLSLALGLLFLPVALLLLDWALMFLELVGDLSEKQKMWVGIVLLAGIALGALLFLFGSFILALGGMLMALTSILTPIGLFVGFLLAIAALIAIPLLLMKTANGLDGLKGKLVGFGISAEAIDKVVQSLRDFKDAIEDAGGPVDFLKEKFGELIDRFIGEETQNKIKEAGRKSIGKYLDGMSEFIEDNPLILLGAIIGLFIAGPIGASLGAAGGFGIGKYLDGMKEGTADSTQITDAVSDIITQISEAIVDNFPQLLQIGAMIMEGIIEGFINAGGAIGDAIREFFGGPKGKSRFNSKAGELTFTPEENVTDAIIKPSGQIIRTHPKDTIFATQNPERMFGGGGVVINQTNTISGSNIREIEELIKRNNLKLTEDIRRLSQR